MLEHTKTTRATYVVYTRDYVTLPGQAPVEGWSAEFHSGNLHRVETSVGRMIANCREMTGWSIDLRTDTRSEGQRVANAACGINTNFNLNSVEWLGTIKTGFGMVDRVRVTDNHDVRTYDVLRNGALLRAVYAVNDQTRAVEIRQETLAVRYQLPNVNLFDPATLEESFVPAKYKGD